MPYQKLSEYQAKTLYYNMLSDEERRLIVFTSIDNLLYFEHEHNGHNDSRYVVKVDDGSKRRMKGGLVKINQTVGQINKWISSRPEYTHNYIVENCVNVQKEVYVMFRLANNCHELLINSHGGICLDNPEKDGHLFKIPFNMRSISTILDKYNFIIDHEHTKFCETLQSLYDYYHKYHIIFMEVNPLGLIKENDQLKYIPLDFAILRDSCSDYLMSKKDLTILTMNYLPNAKMSLAESNIQTLDARTGGSLKFAMLNPKGFIWTLVAGGGASVVYTDAIINNGFGHELANYGEYSGNPQEELVMQYCINVFSEMVKVDMNKILFIGGGIANFTDVAVTFNGIINAIEYIMDKHPEFGTTTIWVRRGGPNYKEGLKKLGEIFQKYKIKHYLSGPEAPITQCVNTALLNPILAKHKKLHVIKKEINLSKHNKIINEIFESRFNPKQTVKTKFDCTTKTVLLGFRKKAAQRMMDFDFISNKDSPSLVAIIEPRQTAKIKMESMYWGNTSVLIPVYKTIKGCVSKHAFDTVINFMSYRSAYESSMQILDEVNINNLIIIAEGIPEHLTVLLDQYAKSKNVRLIGPATVGCIKSGQLRIGNTGGSLDNIKECNLNRCGGSVGFVTRSGGLLNELCWIVSHKTDGVYEGISIGGDRWPGSQFIDYIMEYERDENVKMIILLGEVGGIQELLVSVAKKRGLITKPIVGWCMGTSAEYLNNLKGGNIQFGHAGASANAEYESAIFKNMYMKKCGVHVPDTFEDLSELIEMIHSENTNSILTHGEIITNNQPFIDQHIDRKRKTPSFYSSICDETHDELMYNHVPVSTIVCNDSGIGKTLGHLWLKKDIPDWLAKYFELILMVTADHGGMVSGAHNTIVASRAGKDLVSSLCSGLLTIGDYFGGALNKSAQQFYKAVYVDDIEPAEFVAQMKQQSTLVSGIGHKIKSVDNPDIRVKILKEYAVNHFKNIKTIEYGSEVEKITTQKKNNLILNVDGFIAVSLIDAFREVLSLEEIEEIIDMGLINGFFVLGRTMGFIGHWFDQKRLKQGLFRLPPEEIKYLD